jgi:hypothetical protein
VEAAPLGRPVTPREEARLSGALVRLTQSLSDQLARPLVLHGLRAEGVATRPAGRGGVHVSFRFALERGRARQHGCLLVPLADALGLAAAFWMLPDDLVHASRGRAEPDETGKQALLELGAILAAAVDLELRSQGVPVTLRFDGCQGVRADVRPAFPYREGDELLVARATLRFEEFEAFEALLVLPVLDGAERSSRRGMSGA